MPFTSACLAKGSLRGGLTDGMGVTVSIRRWTLSLRPKPAVFFAKTSWNSANNYSNTWVSFEFRFALAPDTMSLSSLQRPLVRSGGCSWSLTEAAHETSSPFPMVVPSLSTWSRVGNVHNPDRYPRSGSNSCPTYV
jgi:hypothetical protein